GGQQIGDALARTFAPAKLFDRAFAGEPVAWTSSFGDATFECRLTPVADGRGGVAGIIALAIDVTERKQAEDTRLALERRLLEAQKLESLGVLAGGIAHDFNNLLVAMLGNAGLALMEIAPGSRARQFVEQIQVAAQRAADLTRQMLAYSGKGRFIVQALSLNDVIDEMVKLLRVSISKQAALQLNLAPNLATISADATQLRQVVMNLITN